MHHEVMHFIYETKVLYPEFFKDKRWLEIGSGNCNPKAKSHTENCEWVGVDLEEGENVDWVGMGHHYKSDKLFDVVCAFEVFEHDPFYDLTIINMLAHLKPGGLFLITCAGLGRNEHGTLHSDPSASPFTAKEDDKIKGWKDFYKNRTPYDFKMVPHWDRLFGGYWVINEGIGDLYYRGFKKDI